jgi:hypothetical protein
MQAGVDGLLDLDAPVAPARPWKPPVGGWFCVLKVS